MNALMNCTIYNDNVDNILHKCKKATEGLKKICKWNGSLGDYIKHVEKYHKESYFLITPEKSSFQWTLLIQHDQCDTGILCHRLGYFMYKFYHCNMSGEICFSLTCLYKLKHATSMNYSLVFYKQDQKELVSGNVNFVPCEDEASDIIIDKSILNKIMDHKRAIRFKISIWCDKLSSPSL